MSVFGSKQAVSQVDRAASAWARGDQLHHVLLTGNQDEVSAELNGIAGVGWVLLAMSHVFVPSRVRSTSHLSEAVDGRSVGHYVFKRP